MLPKGTTIYTVSPYVKKPGGFFSDESTLAGSKKSVNAYHLATQVGHSGKSKDFKFGPRGKVRAFTLKEGICVGISYALANDQCGPGRGTQYYVDSKKRKHLKKISITELTKP